MPNIRQCRLSRLILGRDAETPHFQAELLGGNRGRYYIWIFVDEFDKHTLWLPAQGGASVSSHDTNRRWHMGKQAEPSLDLNTSTGRVIMEAGAA